MYSAKCFITTFRITIVSSCLILFPMIASSQESPKVETAAKKEIAWKEFKSKAGEFLVEFAGEAREIEIKGPTERHSIYASSLLGKTIQLSVRVNDQPIKLDDAKLLETVGVKSLARFAEKRKDIKIGHYPGIEFFFDRKLGPINRRTISRVFAIEGRIYQMEILSDVSEVVPEDVVARFFDSFRLVYNVAKPTPYEKNGGANSAVPKSESPSNPMPKTPQKEKIELVDAKFQPGKPTFDPKLAELERSWHDSLRKLPRREYQDRENLCLLRGPENPQGFAFSPDGKLYATVGIKELVIRELATNQIVSVFPGFERHFDRRLGIRFSPDGKFLLSTCVEVTRIGDRVQIGSEKYSIRIVDVKTGSIHQDVPTSRPAIDCALSSDNSTLTVVFNQFDRDGEKFAAWNTKDWTRKPISFPRQGVFTWAFSPDGNYIFVSLVENLAKTKPPIQAWNLTKGTRSLLPTNLAVKALQAHTDGKSLLVTAEKQSDSSITLEYHLIDFATGADHKIIETPYVSSPAILSPDGKYLLISSSIANTEYHTKVLDTNTGKELWSLDRTNASDFMISGGGTLFFRQYYYGAGRDCELFAIEDMLNPDWARLAGAMNKAREVGFEISAYGKTLRAKTREKNFNSKSFANLAMLLPETSILEFYELERHQYALLKDFDELSKLPKLEQIEFRMRLGNDKNFFKALAKLSQVRRLRLQDGDYATETLKDMKNLEEIVFESSVEGIGNFGFKNILGVKNLRKLELLQRVTVDEDTFREIKSQTELRSLNARSATNLTSAIMKDLQSCSKLEKLDLSFRIFSDEHLDSLGKLESLRDLTLQFEASGDKIFTDESLKKLSSVVKNVRNLKILGQTKLTEKGVDSINSERLETLYLDGVMFTDEMLHVLNRFTKLEELSITGGNYVGDGFKDLSDLKNLRILRISGRENISREKIGELQKLLPNTLIEQGF